MTREDAVAEATRVRNRLHADLLVVLPGYQDQAANLVAACHRRTITLRLRRLTGIRVELLLGDHPLLALPGVGVVTAAKLVAETGDVRRFRSADAFAALAGVAPIPASSGQTRHMRLNRGGNRQLNRALWTIATVQAKCHPPAKVYLARKAAEGKSRLDAIRALKRQLVRTVFRLLREGAPVLEMAA